jgi:hypothetical protein
MMNSEQARNLVAASSNTNSPAFCWQAPTTSSNRNLFECHLLINVQSCVRRWVSLPAHRTAQHGIQRTQRV